MALTTKNHSLVVEGSRHAPHNLTYPDAANRIAGTNEGSGIVVDATNLYQVAKQDDDDSLWMMTDDSPLTWVQINTGGTALDTMDAAYDNFGANPADVDIDNAEGQGDLTFKPAGAFSFAVDLAAVTGGADGFEIINGTDHVYYHWTAADQIGVDFTTQTFVTDVAGAMTLQAGGLFKIVPDASFDIDITGTLDLDATGAITIDTADDISIDTTSGNINISTADGAVLIESGAGSEADDITLDSSDDLIFNAADDYDANIGGSATFDAGGAISWDGVGASNFTIDSGDFTLSTTTSGSLILDAVALLDINAGANLDIDVTGTIAIDGSGTIEWSGTNASLTVGGALALDGNITLTGGGSIISTSNGDVSVIPHGAGVFVCGTGTPGHLTPTSGEAYFQGRVEIDGVLYPDNHVIMGAGKYLMFWANTYAIINPNPTYDQTVFGVGVNTGRQLIVADSAYHADDFDHAVATDPIFYVQAGDPDVDNTFWISMTHNQTDGILAVGAGSVSFASPLKPWPRTTAQMTALSPTEGDEIWNSTFKKAFRYNGTTWQVQGETVQLENNSGGALVEGDVVIVDSTQTESCDTTTAVGNELVIGPIVLGGADGVEMTIATHGIWDVYLTAAAVRGNYVETSTTAKQAVQSASPTDATFGIVLENTGGAGLASCLLMKEVF